MLPVIFTELAPGVRLDSGLQIDPNVSKQRAVAGGVQNIFNGDLGWNYNVFVECKNLSRTDAMLDYPYCTHFVPVWVLTFASKCSFLLF